MNRTILTLIVLVITGSFAACNIKQPKAPQPELAPSKSRAGCFNCHDTLSDTLPENHVKTDGNDLGGCLECHSQKGVRAAFECSIHESHLKANNPESQCDACHQIDGAGNFGLIGAVMHNTISATQETVTRMKPYYLSSAKSEYLDHTHAQNNVTCKDCHGKPFPEKRASMDSCLRCHGTYEKVAALTKGMPYNPHDSHLGEIRCTFCHNAHEKSVSYCTQCHEFDS